MTTVPNDVKRENVMILKIIFYIFATLAVGSAMMVVTARNPVRSVLSLVLTFFSMAGIWMLMSAEFLSLILLLVYVGAVMTLFLFVVMMLNVDTVGKREGFTRYLPFSILVIVVLLGLMIVAFGSKFMSLPMPASPEADYSNISQLGAVLYTQYAYPFEIAGVLLLAAIVAAISLSHRAPRKRKVQSVSEQLSVRREDRVRLVKMSISTPLEKKNDLS